MRHALARCWTLGLRRSLAIRSGLVLLGGLVLAFPGARVAAGPGAEPPAASAADGLQELKDIDQLQALFNRDAGKPRLILLLSPT